jgi:hypothetical protein
VRRHHAIGIPNSFNVLDFFDQTGPTDDKPEIVASPPRDPNVLSISLNLRVTDIRRYYDLWSSWGAIFITEPKIHATELRCYMRDPDGYLIEVGQTTMTASPLDLYR